MISKSHQRSVFYKSLKSLLEGKIITITIKNCSTKSFVVYLFESYTTIERLKCNGIVLYWWKFLCNNNLPLAPYWFLAVFSSCAGRFVWKRRVFEIRTTYNLRLIFSRLTCSFLFSNTLRTNYCYSYRAFQTSDSLACTVSSGDITFPNNERSRIRSHIGFLGSEQSPTAITPRYSSYILAYMIYYIVYNAILYFLTEQPAVRIDGRFVCFFLHLWLIFFY